MLTTNHLTVILSAHPSLTDHPHGVHCRLQNFPTACSSLHNLHIPRVAAGRARACHGRSDGYPLRVSRRWILPPLYVLLGVAVATRQVATGHRFVAGFFLVVFLVAAILLSPVVFPRSIGAVEAERLHAVDGRPVVYWRPGCRYCLRLRMRLGRQARSVHWVDIWKDPEGAAAVRAATGGDETVPTVLVAGAAHVNPDPAWLRGQLA